MPTGSSVKICLAHASSAHWGEAERSRDLPTGRRRR